MIVAIGILMSLIILFLSVLVAKLDQDIKALKSKVKDLTTMQNDHNLVICKLMFHKAEDLQEFETCDKIKKALPKVNMFRILE